MLKGLQLTFPIATLIAANLVPLFGVLFLNWDVGTILLLYWLESVVIGLLNIPKILFAKGGVFSGAISLFGNLFNAAFFTVHFGAFCAGHGVFLKEMFDVDLSFQSLFAWGPMTIAAASFFISHFVSMMVNYFGKGEYKKRTGNEQMFTPYGRVIVMHLTILFGGFLALKFGAPAFALIVLIGIKTLIDVIAHNREHRDKDETNLSTV
jgi:hypothetical protein